MELLGLIVGRRTGLENIIRFFSPPLVSGEEDRREVKGKVLTALKSLKT